MHHGIYLFVQIRRLGSDDSAQERVKTAAIPTGESRQARGAGL
ncbi:Unknown protein sequence [Pseudomonas syringae pv. maculicola str. M6]|nr:Unknown protein sequence [Pseudomonas syringae pv. maculicola str. M6]